MAKMFSVIDVTTHRVTAKMQIMALRYGMVISFEVMALGRKRCTRALY